MIPENNQSENLSNESESTIFSDPAHYQDEPKEKAPKSKKWVRVLAVFLAACVLGGASLAALKLIPEKVNTDKPSNTITVTTTSSASVEAVKIKNSKGEITFKPSVSQQQNDSSLLWAIDGISASLTDSSKIGSATASILTLTATAELEKTEIDYGFQNPTAEALVDCKEGAAEDYTITIGKEVTGGYGYYCSVSTKPEMVYVVDTSVSAALQCVPTDFAISTAYTGIEETTENADCFSEGEIIDFDYFSLSGKQFPKEIRISVQEDESINAYFAFLMEKPSYRIADTAVPQEVVDFFISGVSSAGAYCFNPDANTLKQYGLDNPDAVVSMSMKNKVYSVKIAYIDDTFCALYSKQADIIFKVDRSAMPFLEYKVEDYYSTLLILENLSGVSKFEVKAEDQTYFFDVSYEQTESDRIYTIKTGDKTVDTDAFKDMYQTLVGITPISHETKNIEKSVCTVRFVHSSDIEDTVLTFKEYSSGRYQAEANGMIIGIITKSDYDTFLNKVKNIAK